MEITESGGVPVEVTIRELTPKNGEVFSAMPMALTPGPPVMTKALEAAIEEVAMGVAHRLPRDAPNRIPGYSVAPQPRGGPLPPVDAGGYAGAITSALRALDSSYLAVHGPPGTGKTFTAARVIADLVTQDGWLVGVVAQSHAVVEHLLDQVVAAGVPADRVARRHRHTVAMPSDSDSRQRLCQIHRGSYRPRGRDRRHRMGFREHHKGGR